MDVLRFIAAGSVDDGKSTLIGRLLNDSCAAFDDQLESLRTADGINLAHLTDGLKDERAQGITVDVAYRYFNTAKRKFIVADTPGHAHYTRNMITGTSTAQVALVLVDARSGVVEQTRRHSYIASLLGLRTIVVCVNKMDLVNYDETVFEKIRRDCIALANNLRNVTVVFVPMSALHGDNVVEHSQNMNWYHGPALLDLLETVNADNDASQRPARMSVQLTLGTQQHQGVAGIVWSGVFSEGDDAMLLPSQQKTKITSIRTMNGSAAAGAPQSVTITLNADTNLMRGDVIAPLDQLPLIDTAFDATCCWLSDHPMQADHRLILRAGTAEHRDAVLHIHSKLDMHTMQEIETNETLQTNDIARVRVTVSTPVVFDSYQTNRHTGGMILIDPDTNETVAALVVD